MNIQVEYKNAQGIISTSPYRMTRLAFIKHMAIAGLHYAPSLKKFIRGIGMLLHYSTYIQSRPFYNGNKFSLPPANQYDPTEQGQFSNQAGKAIADFLSKRIDNSLYTVNYEAAMKIHGMPMGTRPDLLAFNAQQTFAIEAKGVCDSSVSQNDMITHKTQAGTGGISVGFSVACVSYRLYTGVQCKYHDPPNADAPDDDTELFRSLTKSYYSGLAEFLTLDKEKDVEYQGEKFYKIQLMHVFKELSLFVNCKLSLLLPIHIQEYAENGLPRDIKPFKHYPKEGEVDVYIDNDRVGLQFEQGKAEYVLPTEQFPV